MSQLHTPTPWTREHLNNLTEADKDFILLAVNHYETLVHDLREMKDCIEVEWDERMGKTFSKVEADLRGT